MKLITKDERIRDAVSFANAYLNSPDFQKDILSVKKFDHSNVDPKFILGLFEMFADKPIEIKCTYFGWWYRKVLGRAVGDGFAYVNSSGLYRSLWSISATVVHEACHVVDEWFPNADFGHGGNSSRGKNMTFPYFIDERAETWIKREVLRREEKKLSMKVVLLREITA